MTSPHTLRQDAPILFSGAMVRAILEGRKTQTRRIIKPRGKAPSLFDGTWTDDYVLDPGNAEWRAQDVRYHPGMLLWCRETCMPALDPDKQAPFNETFVYQATDEPGRFMSGNPDKWLPSIHMPRRASRLTLEVTAVKVERLQDISEEDAKAEGVDIAKEPPDFRGIERERFSSLTGDPFVWRFSAARAFADLWTSIHGPGSWEANPWIVAVSFKPHARNIDHIRRDAE